MRNYMIDGDRSPPQAVEGATLPAVLARTIDVSGDREAFVAPGERFTWRALGEATGRTAAALAAAGVRQGDHVGVLMGNGAAWVTTFFAVATLGAVTVPISTRLRRDELAYCLRQADVSTLVAVTRFLDIDFGRLLLDIEPALGSRLPGSALPRLERVVMVGDVGHVGDDPCPPGATRLLDLESQALSENDAPPAPSARVAPDDLLLIQYTSGTTSRPKGVMLTHQNMLQNAAAVARRLGVRPDDRYFSIRPYFHVAGTTLSLLVALTTGACLLTLPTFDVERSLRCMVEERCTLTSGNDTIFLMLMGHPAFDASALRLRGGWAAAGPEVMRRIHDVMGIREICYAYGLSEASPNVVLSSWQDPLELRVAGLALPHDGTELRVCDPDDGTELAVGAEGEIQVRGWNVMRGYYDMLDATADVVLPDGWLRTGDVGSLDSEGRLRLVGRLKDIIRVGGENVAPADVEEVLHAHPAVRLAQVIGVPDARLGEVPAAYVQLKPDAEASVEDLFDWCRDRCAGFKVPRHLRIVETFEPIGMTGSSKVQKTKLREFAVTDLGLADQSGDSATMIDRTRPA